MPKRKQLQRIEETILDPLTFVPFFFGLAGLLMDPTQWGVVGYANLPQHFISSLVFCVGISGFFFRWRQQESPSRWFCYTKVCALGYLGLAFSLLNQGSLTGFILFVGYFQVARKDLKMHKLFSCSRKLLWKSLH